MPRREPLDDAPPILADIAGAAGSLTSPPDVLPDWAPHCTVVDGRRRCGRIMYLDVNVWCCKKHQTRWLPDDPRIRWKPPEERRSPSQTVSAAISGDLLTALDCAVADSSGSRQDVVRAALATYPPVAFHLGLIRGHPKPEPEVPLARGAKEALEAAREVADDLTARLDEVPLENLHLTDPLYACLHSEGIETLGELGALSMKDLLSIPKFPLAGLGEVKAALTRFNPLKEKVWHQIQSGVDDVVTTDFSRAIRVRVSTENIVVLRDVKRMSFREIGEATGIRAVSVEIRYRNVKSLAVFNAPLEGFTADAAACFATAGIVTMKDLLDRSEDDLLALEGFRSEMLDQVRSKIIEYGSMWNLGPMPAALRARVRDERFRRVVEMRDTLKLSWDQIAAKLDCSQASARERYKRAVLQRAGERNRNGMSRRVWRETFGPVRVRGMLGTATLTSPEEDDEPSPQG